MLTDRCPACLKGMSLSSGDFVGILAGIRWRKLFGWKLGGFGGHLQGPDMLHHLLEFALPQNVIQNERRKDLNVARQLLAAGSGAKRCSCLKAWFQSVFLRKILVNGWCFWRSTM
jgi:hypothetical protein